jgi:hypothetical protein
METGLAVTRRELEVMNDGERYARRLQAPTTERTLADLGAADEEPCRFRSGLDGTILGRVILMWPSVLSGFF